MPCSYLLPEVGLFANADRKCSKLVLYTEHEPAGLNATLPLLVLCREVEHVENVAKRKGKHFRKSR